MKKITQLLASVLLTCSLGSKVNAQTLTGSVQTQPCNNNGAISLTVTGLTPPISYTAINYSSGQVIVNSNINSTTHVITGLPGFYLPWGNANLWYVTAFDGVNYANDTYTLTPAFGFTAQVNNGTCPAPSTLQATAFSGGTGPYTCSWTHQATSSNTVGNPVYVTATGDYNLVVTDANGCIVSAPGFSTGLTVMPNATFTVSINGTQANCTNGTASAIISGSGITPYSYTWNNGAVTPTLGGLTTGFYNCTVTDGQGCQSTAYYYLQQAVTLNINTTINNATCVQTNGAVTTFVNGGTAPYSYNWSNGATTANISGLTGGQSYQLQVTDANGCTGSGYAFVATSSPVYVTYTATPSSCTSPTGGATLTPSGGTAPYTVVWYISPLGSGNSITNKAPGTYSFKVTDANGCINTGAVVIPPVSVISAGVNAAPAVCPATTGAVSATVSGGTAPYTYLWNNASTTSGLTGVPFGVYTCTITDAVGCSVIKYTSLYQTSPISIGATVTPVNCIFAANGAATAAAIGGASPYTYSWSNGQTGASATGLNAGYYWVTATDANGCHKTANVQITNSGTSNSCYCTITGTVYADANSNCTQNTGENGIQNIQVHCSGVGYAYTNSNGVYSFQVPSGTYTITESVQQIYPLASCQTNNQVVSVVAAANCVSTVNFANNVVPISDLHIITSNINFPVPGNVYNQKVIVQNEGTITESSIQIGYRHDGNLSFGTCAPWSLTQQNAVTYPNWYSITSGFTSLAPANNSATFIDYNVPTNIPVNTNVSFNDSVSKASPIATSWLVDNTPWNNVNALNTTVLSSYDPNFKEVSPQGTSPQGIINTHDSILTYVVHFQNTGNYYAQNIVVVDTIDTDLNISTLRPGYSDHNFVATVDENRVARFRFNNINLPWKSNFGDALSSGMFVYSVKLKKNLTPGTQIKNKAAIYFDYNEPVITNTTLNTIGSVPTSLNTLNGRSADGSVLFPNPASNYVTLNFVSEESASAHFSVFDISGREVVSRDVNVTNGDNSLTENTSSFQNGVYLVQLKTADKVICKKLIVSK